MQIENAEYINDDGSLISICLNNNKIIIPFKKNNRSKISVIIRKLVA